MHRPALSLLLLSALLFAGCAPLRTRPVGVPVNHGFASALMQEWTERASLVTTLRGLATVTVKAPLNSVNGTQVVLAEQPGRLRAETLSPFGVPMLLLKADGETLGVSVPSQNVYYTGAATAENLGTFVNLPLPPVDLVDILLYRPPLIKAWKEEAFTLQEGGWLLVRHATTHRQELVFNPLRQLVEVSYFEDNDLLMTVSYAQFPLHGETFPHRLTFFIPAKHATINLEFTELETNRKLRADLFELSPPPGAKVVYLTAE